MSMAESRPASDAGRLFVVMGVAGCGKSSVGAAVAEEIGATYLDGDDFHPPSNIEKMSRGEALTDEDRWPWLRIVAREMASRQGIVLAGCSALRRAYRDMIVDVAGEPVTFVFLDGTRDLIAERMKTREGHFMPLSLLDSQFATLERPQSDERAILVDISKSQAQVVADICAQIGKDGP